MEGRPGIAESAANRPRTFSTARKTYSETPMRISWPAGPVSDLGAVPAPTLASGFEISSGLSFLPGLALWLGLALGFTPLLASRLIDLSLSRCPTECAPALLLASLHENGRLLLLL